MAKSSLDMLKWPPGEQMAPPQNYQVFGINLYNFRFQKPLHFILNKVC